MDSRILEFRYSGYGKIIVKYQTCQVTPALQIEEFQADKSRDKTDTTGTPPLTRFFLELRKTVLKENPHYRRTKLVSTAVGKWDLLPKSTF